MKHITSILLFFLAFYSWGQLYTFKNINHKNGLSLSSVLSVSQDKYGYIWIGTDGFGLQRYDGKQVKTIQVDPIDNEHHVTYIDPTENGIYFSSRYTGFYRYKNKKLTCVAGVQKDLGDYLAIKKIGKSLCMVGQRKIRLWRNKKPYRELAYPVPFNEIIQLLEIPGGAIIITPDKSYHVQEFGIREINDWLNEQKEPVKPVAGRFYNGKLELYETGKNTSTLIYLTKEGNIFSKQKKRLESAPETSFVKVFSRGKVVFALDDQNQIYTYKKEHFVLIPKNTTKTNFVFRDLFIDRNNDFWASSSNAGIFKISDEPFTKIDLHPVYQDPLISFIYRSDAREVFISNFDGKTFYSNYKMPDFKSFDIRLFTQTSFRGQTLFGCEYGIVHFDGNAFRTFKGIKPGKRVLFLMAFHDKLYYSPEGGGLLCYDAETSKITEVLNWKKASHIYTAQANKDESKIYFGTNDGIFEWKTGSGVMTKISARFKTEGSYSGVSCTDSYGTMWFTLDKKIVGITKREEYVVIEDKKYFNSTLFYNLNADPYGNLIIGTNVGITKLKIDHLGNVINYFHYNNNNGFGGFETHMRSNFQHGPYIYLGTIEGMFVINTEKLEYLPNPPLPLIFQHKEKENSIFNSDEELIKINYLALNPKLNGIQYTYRLKGKTKAWSELTPKTEAYFSNLSDQEYIFQVRSTYDGMNFSPIASYKIVKDTPFWKSKWFILFLILSIALANVIVLDRSKSFELNYVIENQNVEINSRVRSLILIFGFVANTGANYLAPFLEHNLPHLNGLNSTIGVILFLLFLLSVFKHPFPRINKYLLQIGLFVVIGQCYIAAYLTGIHPVFVIIIALTTAFTPFVLNKIFEVIILSVFHVLSVVSIVFLLDHSIFSEVLFIVTIMVSICLSIFTTYIRNESLQKLIFISGVINKGNIMAIAFNQDNKITYISENSYDSLGINPNEYLNKNISALNRFVNQEPGKRTIDLSHEFKDEQKHIVPMKKEEESPVRWIEWSCKIFSKKIKVIFGQDISERINIENNYESLVENAQDLIYYVDINGNFVYVNNKFQEILGFEESELLGRDSMFIVNVFQQPAVRKFYEDQFRTRTLNTYNEVIIRKKDGTEIWVGQNSTLLYASGSNKIIKGFLCLARDITEKRNQQKVIEAQHEDITSSINYAKTIQYNLLPHQDKIRDCFTDFAVFYAPKDIVSGDFYWFEKISNKTIFVLSDCTGHGVPGAFMTLLGINLINQIIGEDKVLNPGKILSKIDEKLVEVLPRQGNSDLRDGMEMLVLIYDHHKNSYQYACAGGKFITLDEKNGFVIHRGESKHIGDAPEANFSKYNTYTLDIAKPDAFYFFTDGIQDQFSESTHKKFTLKRMLEILRKHPDAPMSEQVREMRSKFHKWKGNAEQTDDITFIGFKF
ncbi:MAG: PAS domain S-box protein [Bacteroidota bacterium]